MKRSLIILLVLIPTASALLQGCSINSRTRISLDPARLIKDELGLSQEGGITWVTFKINNLDFGDFIRVEANKVPIIIEPPDLGNNVIAYQYNWSYAGQNGSRTDFNRPLWLYYQRGIREADLVIDVYYFEVVYYTDKYGGVYSNNEPFPEPRAKDVLQIFWDYRLR